MELPGQGLRMLLEIGLGGCEVAISFKIKCNMNIEKYHLKSDDSFSYFEFISVGIKGPIRKIIEFQRTSTPGLYNLAFGDKNVETGELDDLAVSNNGDTEKVLATVVSALYTFFDKNPEALVYATGSTPARTRLYRMGISKFYDEIVNDFHLFGQMEKKLYSFEIGEEYEGFVAQRKLD
jgi:hypothetical protein